MYALHWLRKMNSDIFKDMGTSPSDYWDTVEKIKESLNRIATYSVKDSGGSYTYSHENEQLTITLYSEKYGQIVHIYTIVEV